MPPAERQAVIERIGAGLRPAGGERLRGTSGATREGIGEVLEACWQAVEKGDGSIFPAAGRKETRWPRGK